MVNSSINTVDIPSYSNLLKLLETTSYGYASVVVSELFHFSNESFF